MTAHEFRHLLTAADEVARRAMASARALLATDYNHGRTPGRHKFEAAYNLLVKSIPTFGGLSFQDVVWTSSELRIVEKRVCPAYFSVNWRDADNAPPCVGLGTLWLTANPDGLQVGAEVTSLFSMEAIDQWFAVNPGPSADYGGRPKSWPNPPIIYALNCESEWQGEVVGGVRMITEWVPVCA